MNRKLRSIVRHEYLTIIKQPAFLLTMLGVPLLILAVGAISFFAERTAESSLDELAEDINDVAVVDQSGLINEEIVDGLGFEIHHGDSETIIEQVRDGERDGALVYSEDLLESRTFDVYVDESENLQVASVVTDIGNELLNASLAALVEDENLVALLRDGATPAVTAYQDGELAAGMEEYIVPGAFLVLFFVILFFTMGYMLLGVAEEKENRSMEMVLSYVRPRTLMTGKLLSIGLVGLTQMLFFATVGMLAYLGANRFENHIGLPLEIDPSALVFDPMAITVGFLVLTFGFLMFAALMSGVAAMMPGVKEANSLSSIFFLVPLVPLYASQMIVIAPESMFVRFLTFFPLTSPPVMLARNTLGNIGIYEAIAGIVVLALFTVLAFLLASKLFRLGALEYADRVKLSSLLKK